MKGTKKTNIHDPENGGSIKNDLSKKYSERETVWKTDWFGGVRLGVLFPKKTSDPAAIAEAMQDIIEETSEKI